MTKKKFSLKERLEEARKRRKENTQEGTYNQSTAMADKFKQFYSNSGNMTSIEYVTNETTKSLNSATEDVENKANTKKAKKPTPKKVEKKAPEPVEDDSSESVWQNRRTGNNNSGNLIDFVSNEESNVEEEPQTKEVKEVSKKKKAPAKKNSKVVKKEEKAKEATKDVCEVTINTEDLGDTSPSADLGKLPEELITSPPTSFNYLISNTKKTQALDDGRYPFLLDVKDANGVKKGQPGYDPSTLYIPDSEFLKFTPFERQFWEIKRVHFDTVVFFKKGKFYELYENDADVARSLFDLRVKERINMRMAGFPTSSYDAWASKFLAAGYKVARVDEKENALAKKMREKETGGAKTTIIQRDLVEVVTPATVYNCDYINSPLPFYIAVILSNVFCEAEQCQGDYHYSILLYDASVNFIYSKTLCDSHNLDGIKTILAQNDIREIRTDVVNLKVDVKTTIIAPACNLAYQEKCPNIEFSTTGEMRCFNELYLYFEQLQRTDVFKGATCSKILKESNCMQLDASTIKNMDILTNNFDETVEFSLIQKINHCSTPFGIRKLYKWVLSPLTNLAHIEERRMRSTTLRIFDRDSYMISLKSLGDLDRLHCRLRQNRVSLKDLKQFVYSLGNALVFLNNVNQKGMQMSSEDFLDFFRPGYFINGVDMILKGFNSRYKISEENVEPVNEEDELFVFMKEKKAVEKELDNYLSSLSEELGIAMSYKHMNKDIYQIEVAIEDFPTDSTVISKHKIDLYSKTKKMSRFYTKETKKLMLKFKEADERIFQSQNSALIRATKFFEPHGLFVNELIDYIATCDCYMSFFIFNEANRNFVEPEFIQGTIQVEKMTNPIYSDYIHNDFVPENNVTVLTGPNMGGKSTFLRSLCLNIILAQIGLNVACGVMKLPIFDQIFTRIGASDSLAKNESTFMMEMNECGKILNKATKNSFVIVDELGRGTSTKDGDAIARAVLSYLKKIGCLTLFSTHYHKLVHDAIGVDKKSITYKIEDNQIIFLYKLKDGIADESHGIYVAKMAGVPESILQRATEIRAALIKKQE